jgi:hypothetical protein
MQKKELDTKLGVRMKTRYRSIKIERNKYRVPIPKRRMQISADMKLSVCEHKGRWVAAFTHGWDNVFYGCDTLNRTEALKMISFLSDYVNLVKPTEATVLNASIRARTNAIVRDAETLTGLAVEVKNEHKR